VNPTASLRAMGRSWNHFMQVLQVGRVAGVRAGRGVQRESEPMRVRSRLSLRDSGARPADFMDGRHIRMRRDGGADALQGPCSGLHAGGFLWRRGPTEFTKWSGRRTLALLPGCTQTKAAARVGRRPWITCARTQAACGTRSERTSPPMSTISATRPSPRMVAPDTPPIRR